MHSVYIHNAEEADKHKEHTLCRTFLGQVLTMTFGKFIKYFPTRDVVDFFFVHDKKKNCKRNFILLMSVLFTDAESREMNTLAKERVKCSDNVSRMFFQLNSCGSHSLVD
jgi:hypothetical protein